MLTFSVITIKEYVHGFLHIVRIVTDNVTQLTLQIKLSDDSFQLIRYALASMRARKRSKCQQIR